MVVISAAVHVQVTAVVKDGIRDFAYKWPTTATIIICRASGRE